MSKNTPVVDGYGIKDTLERSLVHWVSGIRLVEFSRETTLILSAVDRFGMTEEIEKFGGKIIYGDLPFAMGIPLAIRSPWKFHAIANRLVMYAISHLPFKMLYPGEHLEKRKRWDSLLKEATCIVGDARLLLEALPEDPECLKDKVFLTNTLRPSDIVALKKLGIGSIVTSSPNFGGSYLGTNVLDALL